MFLKIKQLILYFIYPWYRRGNKILVHKRDGDIVEVSRYFGLTVNFKGKNNTIEIYEPLVFKRRMLCNRSKFRINGDNNEIVIRSSKKFISNLKIYDIGSNNKIHIGKDWFQSGACKIDFCNQDNKVLSVGSGCMFGQNVEILLGDWHSITDKDTGKCLNKTKQGVSIGDNVWIARDVRILKDAKISNYSIVGIGSLVTKGFKEENSLIAGVPAEIKKTNVDWNPKNPK